MSRKAPPPVPLPKTGEKSGWAGWLFGIGLLLWWFGGYGLVIYGTLDDRGPFAFLTGWQIALFGGANMLVGAGLGVVIIFVLPGRLFRLWHRLAPQSPLAAFLDRNMRAATRSRGETAALAAARWAEMDDAARLAALRRQRNITLGIACALLLMTWGVERYVAITANRDAGQPLARLVVAADGTLVRHGHGSWVQVSGVTAQRDAVMEYDYSIRGHAYRDYYTPLLPAGWQASQQVTLLEKDETIPRYHDRWDRADPPGPIEGELATGGPRPDIAALFRRHGYAVGDWTSVLTRKRLHGVVPGEADGMDWVIWLMGGAFAALFGAMALMAQFRRRSLLRRMAG